MSDPILFDIDFKHKMAWVWTTLNLWWNIKKYPDIEKDQVIESIPLSFITQVPKYGAFDIPGSVETSFMLADSSVEPKWAHTKMGQVIGWFSRPSFSRTWSQGWSDDIKDLPPNKNKNLIFSFGASRSRVLFKGILFHNSNLQSISA